MATEQMRRTDPSSIDWRLVAGAFVLVAVALHLSPPLVAFAIIEVMIFALYASALNLLLSYSGMVSFGHAVYFGLGAYGLAITIAKFGWPIWAGVVAGPLVERLLRARVRGALRAVDRHLRRNADPRLRGDHVRGRLPVVRLHRRRLGHLGSRAGDDGALEPAWFGVVVLVVVTVCILFPVAGRPRSPLGLTIRAVGQNPVRAAAMGHGRKRVQLAAFVISAFLSGVAGTLYGIFHGNVFPEYVGVLFTIDGLVMVLLGGLYSFGAGIYGAIVYKLLDNVMAHYFEYWQLVIGVILVLVVLVSPAGIAGLVATVVARLRGRRMTPRQPPVTASGNPTSGNPAPRSRCGGSSSASGSSWPSTGWTSRSPRERSGPSSARTEPARPPSSTCSAGSSSPTAGTVEVHGRRLVRQHPHQVARLGVGRTFQISNTFRRMTVLDNMLYAHHAGGGQVVRARRGAAPEAPRAGDGGSRDDRPHPLRGPGGGRHLARGPQAPRVRHGARHPPHGSSSSTSRPRAWDSGSARSSSSSCSPSLATAGSPWSSSSTTSTRCSGPPSPSP